jgi:mono/diheme cytochrome c family protein
MFEILAFESRATIAYTIAGVVLLLGGLLYLSARGEIKGRRKARVPAALRPGQSDEALERRVLERYLIVGAITTLAMAVWLPAYWLREPTRLDNKRAAFIERESAEGESLYLSLCATCHGEQMEGLPRSVTLAGEQVTVAEPPLRYIYSRYDAAGRSEQEIDQLLLDAISQGRPGTVMPTWSMAYGGSLNSAQIENLIIYIQSQQEEFPKPERGATGAELFAANCATCHGPNADGEGGVGPNLRVALSRMSPEAIRETLLNGRIRSEHATFGYSMPSWAVLGEDAIDALLDFIVSIQEG